MRPRLPDILLSYGQVGVGVKCGLEAAIHSVWAFIEKNSLNEDLPCLKIDMKNAFNECHRESLLQRLQVQFPDLFAWAR